MRYRDGYTEDVGKGVAEPEMESKEESAQSQYVATSGPSPIPLEFC